jgi:ABC-type phosphate transport system substrate-binding protein
MLRCIFLVIVGMVAWVNGPTDLAAAQEQPRPQEQARTQEPARPQETQSDNQHLALMHLIESLEPYHPKGEIRGTAIISGSTTMQTMARSWSERFRKFHP